MEELSLSSSGREKNIATLKDASKDKSLIKVDLPEGRTRELRAGDEYVFARDLTSEGKVEQLVTVFFNQDGEPDDIIVVQYDQPVVLEGNGVGDLSTLYNWKDGSVSVNRMPLGGSLVKTLEDGIRVRAKDVLDSVDLWVASQ